jgi:drug/metabolite transporter (DMT)-like permease
MFKASYLLVLFSVVSIAVGQIIFKFAALHLSFEGPERIDLFFIRNYRVILLVAAALSLYFISTIAWLQALRTVPLSIAFMFNALSFALVPAAGFFLFGEQIPRYFFLGTLFIVAGIVLISRP